MMKKMKLEVMILGVAIAVVAYAQEAPADENNPPNAVVKLEVSTAKPDIFCPWANRPGASSGSGIVIAPGRILRGRTKEKLWEYDGFEILLFHRANLLDEFADCSFDLILSGHMHGGQVRIPMLGGLAAPRSSYSSKESVFFPRYFGGRYEMNGTVMIVNRGLGNPTVIPRLFNRPEMIVITLKKKV